MFVNGIKEEAGPDFFIAPNPSNGIFDLSFAGKSNTYSISIFSADGKLVYVEELPRFSGSYKKQIDLSVFGSGLYLVRLADEKTQNVQHIIVY